MELTLKLKGLMQSYGGDDPWTAKRRTQTKPTETAVKGIVECALGLARAEVDVEDDKVRHDIWDNVEVIIHNPDTLSEIIVDDQVVNPLIPDNTNPKQFLCADGSFKEKLPQIRKEYIAGGEFKVTLKGNDGYIEKIKYRLMHPVYPYSLGRACCIPSEPVIQEE